MNISNKKLKKALELYQNGDYDTALKICEKFLEKDYSNEEALFLEGDILYKLGRIDDAIVTWKINSEYNNNEEATNRLAAVDKERKAQALSYTNIQNMSSEDRVLLENAYRENIELKKQVENSELLKDSTNDQKSDENTNSSINNMTNETEDPDSVKEYDIIKTDINDILKETSAKNQVTHEFETMDIEELRGKLKHLEETNDVSSKNTTNKNINATKSSTSQKKSQNIEADIIPRSNSPRVTSNSKTSKKKIIIPAIVVAALIIVSIAAYASSKKSTSAKPQTETNTGVDHKSDSNTVAPNTNSTSNTTTLNAEQTKKFESDVDYLISANSIDGIDSLLASTPKASIPTDAMPYYTKALDYMENQGITYYYDNGMSAYNNNDYLSAIDYFKKAAPYAKNDFRGPTMLFLTGAAYEKLNNPSETIATYKQFLQEYPNSESYTPEILYYLANYYSSQKDTTLAKQYAKDLQTKFPSSMYNNDNIKNILN
ncbi:MAG: tetratricopeptide repeat protein [Sarcina sp.]